MQSYQYFIIQPKNELENTLLIFCQIHFRLRKQVNCNKKCCILLTKFI